MKYNPYSISKMSTFKQCPLKFKYHYIDKIRFDIENNFALIKGDLIHKILEKQFNYNVEKPEQLTNDEFNNIKKIVKDFESSDLGQKFKKLMKVSVLEEDFAFKIENKKLELCDFWDENAWCRGSADLYYVDKNNGIIVDWKSGKDHSNNEDFGIKQGTMYAIYLFLKYSYIENIKAIFVFVEHNTSKTLQFNRNNLNKYIRLFFSETKEIETTEFFKEKVSALCDYCDFYKNDICTKPKELEKKSNDFMNSTIDLNF